MGMYCTVAAMPATACDEIGEVEELMACVKPGAMASLEKSWHGLHYLLTGASFDDTNEADPLGFLMQGGDVIGDDPDGAARFFRPPQVKALAGSLAAVSDDILWQRFDAAAMTAAGIYPEIWDEPEDDLKEEYLHYFHELKAVIAGAAVRGDGLLVSIG